VQGGQKAFGPKDEILARSTVRQVSAPAPLKVVQRTNG
jgi:hypothetical protein